MTPARAIHLFVTSLLLALAVGCSSRAEKAEVRGTVTVDGAPLKAGQIRFVPANSASSTAGATISEGEFVAELTPGSVKVEISAPKVVGKQKMYDTPDSPSVDVVEELLPPRYNVQSELTLDVKAGEQSASFPLTTK